MMPEWALEILRPIVGFFSRLFWRVRWRDTHNIPLTGGGIIIAANHQTYIDPFWVGVPVHRPIRFLAWDAAFSWPVVGYFLKLFGAWPLQFSSAIDDSAALVCPGMSISGTTVMNRSAA